MIQRFKSQRSTSRHQTPVNNHQPRTCTQHETEAWTPLESLESRLLMSATIASDSFNHDAPLTIPHIAVELNVETDSSKSAAGTQEEFKSSIVTDNKHPDGAYKASEMNFDVPSMGTADLSSDDSESPDSTADLDLIFEDNAQAGIRAEQLNNKYTENMRHN